MIYSKKAILDWFHRTLGVNSQPNKNEIQTYCPECNGDRFYFNIQKLVGICHKASCGITPNLEDLIEIVGFGPYADGNWVREEKEEEAPHVILPGWPILSMLNGQLMTTNAYALDYLLGRNLTHETILNWGITTDGERVYVPIYFEGNLVNYNSRVLPGVPGKKYLYCKGVSTSKYLLGWEEAKLWDRLSFVENTFVSLWLRQDLNCTTTFGSHISEIQANLIKASRAKTVAVLWDENAEKNAERGVNRLHMLGVKAAYWSILGQPDDYPKEWVLKWAETVHDAAEQGIKWVDLRKECEVERKNYAFTQ